MGVVILVFILSIILFLYEYRKRKILHAREKEAIEKQHRLDLLHTKLESQQIIMVHIGREIHDYIGQKLTLASLYARKAIHIGASNDPSGDAATIADLIDESLAKLRQLSKTLTHPEFEQKDIVGLLREDARRIHSIGLCELVVESSGDLPAIPLTEKTLLLGMLQEFIQNSIKHSGCKQIHIQFTQAADQLLIRAEDDGRGFDLSSPSNGIGLRNIRNRASELQAALELHSTIGKGTTLTLSLTKPANP